MAAKHTTTKKTFKRKVSRRRVAQSESVVPEQAEPTVISDTSFQTAQPVQPVQITQPVQPQPVQGATPQPPLTDAVQPAPVQASSFESSMTQPAGAPIGAAAVPADAEPEIKIGIENKLVSDMDGKSSDQKPESSQPEDNAQNKSGEKKNLLLPIIFIVLLGAAVLGGLFIYRQNFSNKVEEKINEVSLSPTPTEKPTSTPLDLSKFEIEVLNGSGIAGEASSQQSNLETAGFKVSSIGNADNSDYEETVIQAKKEVDKAFLDKLKITLEKTFAVAKIEELDADADAEADIVVIIGSTKAE